MPGVGFYMKFTLVHSYRDVGYTEWDPSHRDVGYTEWDPSHRDVGYRVGSFT